MKNILKIVVLVILAIGFAAIVAQAQVQWPKEISINNGGKILIYQPQPEDLRGNVLSARAAVSIVATTGEEPTFGAIFFDAKFQTDKEKRKAVLEGFDIKQAKFPAIKSQSQVQSYTNYIQSASANWNMQYSLDELLTTIKQAKQLNEPVLKNDAPNIVYRDKPTTMILLDGEPKLQLDKDLNIQKVVNTPSTIVLNPDDNNYYLYSGGLWYKSFSLAKSWNPIVKLPSRIAQIDAKIVAQLTKSDSVSTNKNTTPTDILVVTEPTELIQTEGMPTYQTVEGTNLLYINNSLSDIFKDINTQQNYLLIAGRWYSSPSLSSSWTYVPNEKLPDDFAKIPEGSEKDGVLTSVKGTDAANEALMDAQIPQTAKVDRKTATINVSYDGVPEFSSIKGTNMQVAENSNITVLKSNGQYYAVDNGVWYVSNNPNGPWQVSTDRPSDVNNIPPDNVAYNVKYVYIYDYTPDYVYAGYTSGYLGSYAYDGTVVWGTGWHYRPWFRRHYYPRPYTWGFGMVYNPWNGWSIGYTPSCSFGWDYYGRNPYNGGWFGPRFYRPAYHEWGFNGGYYGRRAVAINKPNIVINRPHNIMTDRNATFFSSYHSSNLYKKVSSARTVDVHKHDGVLITRNGRDFENNSNYNGNNGFTPNTRPAITKKVGFRNDIDRQPIEHTTPNNFPNTDNTRPAITKKGGFRNDIDRQPIEHANANNFPNTDNTRPSTTQPIKPNRVVVPDRDGNVLKQENGDWKQQNRGEWRDVTPNQTNDIRKMEEQRNRATKRENFYKQYQNEPSANPRPTSPSTPPIRENNPPRPQATPIQREKINIPPRSNEPPRSNGGDMRRIRF